MDRGNKAIIILSILTVIFTIMGGTFAYWNWQSSSEQNTAVTFTVASGFSCSADGGGSISSNDKVLAPAACTNTTYAIKRTITVSPTITQPNKTIYLDMWLKVKNIGTELSNSVNMKYALTTSDTNCTTNVVSTGNFHNATTNTQIELLHYKEYSSTTTETYYLWIWLDSAETDPVTQNQTFNIELSGNCTDGNPFVYTANLYDENAAGWNSVWIGQSVPVGITQYNTPETAMAALKTAGGGTTDYPFFLKHTVGSYSGYCAYEKANGIDTGYHYCLSGMTTQSECNNYFSGWDLEDNGTNYTYVCTQTSQNNAVTDSYVGFVVTSEMASANPGMVAGTYYLKGGDNGVSFLDNAKTIYDAFGGVRCFLDGNSGGNPYTTTPSSEFDCGVSGLNAGAYSNGDVEAGGDAGSNCEVNEAGFSECEVYVDGGGGG